MSAFTIPFPLAECALRFIYPAMLNASLPPMAQRAIMDSAAMAQPIPRGITRTVTTIGGRPAETFASARPRGEVLYLHGGGYVVGSLASHRSLAAGLAKFSGATIHNCDYRLAPEHPYPAAVDDAVAAYLDLLERGARPESLAISGDSAGGGLAMATAQRLISEHSITPAALGLIAPWVDPLSAESDPLATRDIVVSHAWSRQCAQMYRGNATDQAIAPLHGNLHGLPPTLVQVGLRERLYSQDLRLVRALRDAGVDVTFSELPRLWHVGHAQWGIVRDARTALIEVAEYLRAHVA